VFDWLRRLFARPPADPLAGLEPHRVRLVVGLGNPGPQYANTRHNLGFLCVDEIARRYAAAWSPLPDTSSLVAVAGIDDISLVLAKPQTYMNRSGPAVQRLLERLELQREQCLVVYDEMDLPFGGLRLRQRGSPGTHNGMRSVTAALHTEDVPRLRIGISKASQPGQAIDYVLGEFDPDEQAQMHELVSRAADAVLAWAKEGAAVAMNRYNKA
jgi:PTH1 family peptidyl-tRNA hydrolase